MTKPPTQCCSLYGFSFEGRHHSCPGPLVNDGALWSDDCNAELCTFSHAMLADGNGFSDDLPATA